MIDKSSLLKSQGSLYQEFIPKDQLFQKKSWKAASSDTRINSENTKIMVNCLISLNNVCDNVKNKNKPTDFIKPSNHPSLIHELSRGHIK